MSLYQNIAPDDMDVVQQSWQEPEDLASIVNHTLWRNETARL